MSQQLINANVHKRVNHTRLVFLAVVERANLGLPNKATAQRIINYINEEYTEADEFIPASLAARIAAFDVDVDNRRSVDRMVHTVGIAGGMEVRSKGVAYPPKGVEYAHINNRKHAKGIMEGLTVEDIEELSRPAAKGFVVEVSKDYAIEEHELYVGKGR